ncbi:histone-like nucleoid-structuring protein, MvaT/MvaU family [Azomonas macrocytogenes]|uniref:MvaT DNA-binding domain-containing protein n=1 Tax=Azomonas macrocytogenes TaxID=69962 RepID=A0A839T987_AZOMA|nr:histone-like nucleoid-structuring protein, MvaT/MvaU family [Azomonas macrocytogenes]MBB3104595.1 hypothetical protein [Azomonas macrocytogenes]
MSRLAEFRALEEKLRAQLQELEDMKSNASLQREIEFENKLHDLMAEYDQNLQGVIAILDPNLHQPQQSSKQAKPVSSRKERSLKRYKHPETGEIVETKGGNHKVLKQWKSEYGPQAVESWVQ